MASVHRPAEAAIRRSELLAAWSVAIDVAMAAPMESGLRVGLVASRLARFAGAGPDELHRAYHLALLRHIGCTAANREMVALLGDEHAFRSAAAGVDKTSMAQLLASMVRATVASSPPAARPAALMGFAARLGTLPAAGEAVCEVAQLLARRLGLGGGLERDLAQVYERFDGRGFPHRVPGADVSLPAQVVQIAETIVLDDHLGGRAAVARTLAQRRGKAMRSDLVDLAVGSIDQLVAEPAGSVWDAVVAAEPGAAPRLTPTDIDDLLHALGDFVDLTSPFTVGHSALVAELAGHAASLTGLPAEGVTRTRRAGWVHDLGRLSVSLSVWEKRGPLTRDEWERIRLHPYYSERILSRPALLASVGVLAGAHHERLDGSGYHTGATGAVLPPAARILAAADTYATLLGERPHRPACPPGEAARSLRDRARAGQLDAGAVEAVLTAAGETPRRRRTGVNGLTAREVEVLGLVAGGRSNREIAAALQLSAKTVGRHLESIYAKAQVHTRSGATMFAMQHGLLPDPGR